MAIDWSLATQQPNILGNALQGYQAGQEQRRTTQRRNALAQYAQNPNGDLSGIIEQDPELAIQLQGQQRQDRVAEQTLRRQTETDNRERLGRQREAAGQIFVALRRVDPSERQAALVQMIQQRPDVWTPEEAQAAAAAFSQNKVDLTDAQLDALAQGRGVDPNAGDFTIGSGRYRAGATEPYARSQDPVITPFGLIPGAPATAPALSQNQLDKGMTGPALAAPPAGGAPTAPGSPAAPQEGAAQPAIAGPPPPPPGPMPTVRDARSVLAQAIPGFRMTGGARTPQRNAEVGGARNSYHVAGQAIDFAAGPGVTREQIAAAITSAGYDATELFYEGRRGNQGPHWHWAWGPSRRSSAPAPAQQTAPAQPPAPEGIDLGNGRRLIPMETPAQRLQREEAARRARVDDERLALARQAEARQNRPPPVAQGREPTPAQRAQGIDFIEPNGRPHYADRPRDQPTPHQLRTEAVTLRRQFDSQPEVRQFNEVATSYETIRRLSRATPTAQNDIAMVYAYMRMLDPTSVVRETEFATAQNAAGVPERIRNQWNALLSGQRLSPNQRREFANTAGTVYEGRRQNYDALVTQYQGYARDGGLPANTIQARPRPQQQRQRMVASGYTPTAQQQPLLQSADPSAPRGSQRNPFLLPEGNEQRHFNGLRSGAYYAGPDGIVRRKP